MKVSLLPGAFAPAARRGVSGPGSQNKFIVMNTLNRMARGFVFHVMLELRDGSE